MLLSEALKKFCPEIKDLCIGSDCMAWCKAKVYDNGEGVNEGLIDRISDSIHCGDKIEAIKTLRSVMGMSLAESKDHVEQWTFPEAIRGSYRYTSGSNSNEERGFCQRFTNTQSDYEVIDKS